MRGGHDGRTGGFEVRCDDSLVDNRFYKSVRRRDGVGAVFVRRHAYAKAGLAPFAAFVRVVVQ